MVSEDNVKLLSKRGGRYILGMPLRRGDNVIREAPGNVLKALKINEPKLLLSVK